MLTTPKETIGALDRRITLQSRTVSVNDYGEGVEAFTTLATVWAKVDYPLTGSQEEQVEKIHLFQQRVEFTIRKRSDVLQVDRIVYDSKTYDIERIAEIGREGYLKITAEHRA